MLISIETFLIRYNHFVASNRIRVSILVKLQENWMVVIQLPNSNDNFLLTNTFGGKIVEHFAIYVCRYI